MLAVVLQKLAVLTAVSTNAVCSALAASVAALPAFGRVGAARADDSQGAASSRMSYSRFLEYLDMGRVKKVSLLISGCSNY